MHRDHCLLRLANSVPQGQTLFENKTTNYSTPRQWHMHFVVGRFASTLLFILLTPKDFDPSQVLSCRENFPLLFYKFKSIHSILDFGFVHL
jgi:hypothetical protein